MTQAELAILQDEGVREEIRRHLDRGPAQVALSGIAHAALVSTQIKYLQRARTKLPSYYQAGCILPPLAFEQSSSEQTAAAKKYQGELCVDLTCGLGVDSLALSRGFRQVIALERDAVVAETARINFQRLGVTNIQVITGSAEDFLNDPTTQAIDLIYADPARRGSRGEKLFRLEDCSPDVAALMPRMRKLARRVAVKLSPLFDVEEAFRIFGPSTSVEVVSSHDECKEVLVELPGLSEVESRPGTLTVTRAGGPSLVFPRENQTQDSLLKISEPDSLCGYLLIPDVALYKARLVEAYARATGIGYTSPTGYCFSESVPEDFFGRSHPILRTLPYQPKKLKTLLKSEGIERLNILKKDFPESAAQIAQALGVREGSTRYAAFTRLGVDRYMILLDHA